MTKTNLELDEGDANSEFTTMAMERSERASMW
eukprot:CAMPEP_0178829868 /NCGR_PEP_ID=MMETSP0746-20121128/8598_1 /TAXON_ID=913974 /ORGANISM="Nitzschia punctata, Strain CCMP561" /LENGTH=31 /DNA_ID= /DNA_START= /DNA_END= /DNA_ORIENTATION=